MSGPDDVADGEAPRAADNLNTFSQRILHRTHCSRFRSSRDRNLFAQLLLAGCGRFGVVRTPLCERGAAPRNLSGTPGVID